MGAALALACGPNRDGQLQRFDAESARLAAAECACGAPPASEDCAARRELATGFDAACFANAFELDPSASVSIGCEIGVIRCLADCLEADCGCGDEEALRAQLDDCGLRGDAFGGVFWGNYVDCFTAPGSGTCPNSVRLEGSGPFGFPDVTRFTDTVTPACATHRGLPDLSYLAESAAGTRQVTVVLAAGPQSEQAVTVAAYDGDCDGRALGCVALRPGEPTTLTVQALGPFVLVIDGHLRDGGELTITAP